MSRTTIRKNIDRVVDVPSHSEASGFVLYETIIDNHRGSGHVNVVTFWPLLDDNGHKIEPIQTLTKGQSRSSMRYFIQIADKSIREISTLEQQMQMKHRPDYNRPYTEAMNHAIEIKRKRMYIRFVGYGMGGVKVRLRHTINVESKRPHYDYEHIKNPKLMQADMIPVGGSRVVSRV